MKPRTISIHYRRVPDREYLFEQLLIEETPEYSVTFLQSAPVSNPVRAGGQVVLEPGAPVVWFTYPDRWYDIGRFHLRDGTFTGFYANILTPVEMTGDRWETLDLSLDVWRGANGVVELLDEAEFEEAVQRGWISPSAARSARETAGTLLTAAREGRWPPMHVHAWDLDRARAVAAPTSS